MSRFIGLMDMIYSKDKSFDKMNRTTAILETMFDTLRQTHKELYEDTMYKFEEIAYEVTQEKAEEIVADMKPYGEKWNYETVREFLETKGITNHCIEFFLAMNMGYNDYFELAKSVDKQDDIEFYFILAKDFIHDVDAKPFKVLKYFLNS
ncbi:MAG: hypothetical protein M0R51_17480 [Clostridia bacterium]|jgi:hypothetical protein|nr:hypothetical protein [Clostridia bacterium]